MSLQYIIDGYNITNHPLFKERVNSKIKNQRFALLELIKRERLAGSSKNKITVVFDGYPNPEDNPDFSESEAGRCIVFSRRETADERIKKMLEGAANPRNAVVVSDDKEVKFFAKAAGGRTLSVEEFIGRRERKRDNKDSSLEPELTYSQRYKITQELRKIWLE
jgi:predicted RNA-binding protein with PIN domain